MTEPPPTPSPLSDDELALRSRQDPAHFGDTHLAAQYGSGYPVQKNAATVAAVTLEVLEVINLPQSSLAHVRWLYPAEHWNWQLFPEPAGAPRPWRSRMRWWKLSAISR